MNAELVKAWRAALDACAARGGETRPLVIEPPATEARIAEVERALGQALPPRLRRFFLEEAASVQFEWFLPTGSEPPFVDIFSGELSISLERLADLAAENGRRGRIAFQSVANGDLVAIDVRKTGEPVVFLSHDGGDGDSVVLGRDLDDYLARHAALGGVGAEDSQWLPFVSEIGGERTLDPDGDAADRWRRWFGLPPRTEAAAAAERAVVAAKRAQEAAEGQRRADEGGPKTVDELRARLARVPWCARCGQGPTELGLPFPAVWLSTWKETKTRMGSRSWHNAELEASNELTLWLHNNAPDAYQSWNERVARIKATVVAELEPVWKQRQEELGGLQLVSELRTIVVGAAMELDYLSFGHPARFFLNLLPVLEAGHLPCGWKGRWPSGELALF
jgi:cell wall assembly regulator SMI1